MPLCRSVLVLSPIGSISLSYNAIKWNIIDKMLRLFQTPCHDTRAKRSDRSLAAAARAWDTSGPRRCDDSGCQVLRMVRMQLSSQRAIPRWVLFQVLADDFRFGCTKGREPSVSTHSLIPAGSEKRRLCSEVSILNEQGVTAPSLKVCPLVLIRSLST